MRFTLDGLDWNLIKSLVAVARAGSLSGAARDSGISQPTLGRHIAELEAALRITLFERQARGMVLTEAGSALYERAQAVEREAAAFSLAATGRSREIAGTVRITASEVVAHYLMPSIIADLKREEPSLEIELVSSNAVQNLLIRDADIAVRMVEPTQSELIVRRINEIPLGCYAATNYLDRAGRPQLPEDLFRHVVIGLDRQEMQIRGMRAHGYEVDRHSFAIRTDAHAVHWELIRAGAGIGFVPHYLASGQTGIERLLPELDVGTIPVWLTAHRELRTSLRVRRAYDFLADRLGAMKFDVASAAH